jgi:hypothetical protein
MKHFVGVLILGRLEGDCLEGEFSFGVEDNFEVEDTLVFLRGLFRLIFIEVIIKFIKAAY